MVFQSPGAILFKLGPLTVRWYGLVIAVGFFLAMTAAAKRAKEWEIDTEKVINLALTCFMSGIIGARLYFCALGWSFYTQHPLEILAVWKGGLSIHGGLIGAVIIGIAYCVRAELPILRCCDLISSTVPLAQSVGRWGNFFNSEAFGRPVPNDFPLKLFIPPESRPPSFQNSMYFHPTFLYESVWDLLLFLFIYFFASKRLKNYPGVSFFVYLCGYSIGRLLIEPIRVDSLPFMGMPAPILASALTLLISLCGIAFLMSKYLRQAGKN